MDPSISNNFHMKLIRARADVKACVLKSVCMHLNLDRSQFSTFLVQKIKVLFIRLHQLRGVLFFASK